MAARKTGRTHGIVATYKSGCHCAACREAGSRHEYRRRHGREKPEPGEALPEPVPARDGKPRAAGGRFGPRDDSRPAPSLRDPFPSLTATERQRLADLGVNPHRALVGFLAALSPSWTRRTIEAEAAVLRHEAAQAATAPQATPHTAKPSCAAQWPHSAALV